MRDKRHPSRLPRGKSAPLCAYCSVRPGLEREHVVAKAFFDVLPKHNITVPACKECNQKRGDGGKWDIHHDETYMRTVLCMSILAEKNATAQKVLTGPVFRSFQHSPKFANSFARVTSFVSGLGSDGLLTMLPAFDIDQKRMYRVVRKIVRGLFYYFFGKSLPADYEVSGTPMTEPKFIIEVRDLVMNGGHIGPFRLGEDKVFEFVVTTDKADTNMSAWLLIFYGYCAVFALTWPKADVNSDGEIISAIRKQTQ